MKHISFHHILAATAIIATALGVGACAENDFDTSCTETRTIHFVGQAQPEQTRSSLTANSQGGLTFAWSVGDEVVLTHKATGYRVGTLTAKQISSDGLTATFEGDVEVPATAKGNQELTVAFLGNGATIPADNSNHTAAIDLSQQNGVANEMATHDVLFCSSLTVNVDQPIVNAAFSMNHLLAFEDYKFDLPKGVTLGDHKTLILDGRNVYNKCDLNLTTGELQNKELGEIDINCDATGFQLGQLNLAVIPANDVLMSAHVTIGDEEYEYTPANPTTITAGYYYAPHDDNVEAKHLENAWITVTSQDELNDALDLKKYSGKLDRKIKIDYRMGLLLPQSLEGFNSLVFKGVNVQNKDGVVTYKDKLMSNMDQNYVQVQPSTTQGTNKTTGQKEPQITNENGQLLYQTQGNFDSYVYDKQSNKYNQSTVTSKYTIRNTTVKDNTPLYDDGNGGYTTTNTGTRYKIVTSAQGSFNMHYDSSTGKMVDDGVTWKITSVDGYLNSFGELTTKASNDALYECHSYEYTGTNVTGVNLEFCNLDLSLNNMVQVTDQSTGAKTINIITPLNFRSENVHNRGLLYRAVGPEVDDCLNNLTLNIHDCTIAGAPGVVAYKTVKLENCKWNLDYGSSDCWDNQWYYAWITEATTFSAKNCEFTGKHDQMFLLYHYGQDFFRDVMKVTPVSSAAYIANFTFSGCKFICSNAEGYPPIEVNGENLDATDHVTVTTTNCTLPSGCYKAAWKTDNTPSDKVTINK